jgi:hypothetical protein
LEAEEAGEWARSQFSGLELAVGQLRASLWRINDTSAGTEETIGDLQSKLADFAEAKGE